MRRELNDDYRRYWSYPGVYKNSHKTVIYSGVTGGRLLIKEHYQLDWRADVTDERIVSESLGNHDRTSGGGQIIPGAVFGDWSFKAGVRYEMFTKGDEELLPQGEIALNLSDGLRLSLAHSESMRQPSYVELNYESPASLGNAGLDNQKSATTELRLDGDLTAAVSWHAAAFYRRTFDTVDWVRKTEDATRWSATDLGTVETKGAEGGIVLRSSGGSRLNAGYTWLHKSSDAEFYSSRYAFDYPEHFLLVSGLWQVTRIIGIELSQTLRLQRSNPLRKSSDTGYTGRLALHITPVDHVQFNIMVDNLLDDDFEQFPGQDTYSPRRISAGVTLDW